VYHKKTEFMKKLNLLVVISLLFYSQVFSQTYSEDFQNFIYKNKTEYKIIVKNINGKEKVFVKIIKQKNEESVIQKTIELKNATETDLTFFGNYIDKERKFILIISRDIFYILNLYNNRLLGPFKPTFSGIGQDAQSGMLSNVKIIKGGKYIIGYCVDSGSFLFDLTYLYQTGEVISANVPYCNENHIYILPEIKNKQKSFGLYVSTENWDVSPKVIFRNKVIEYDDYSNIKFTTELEIEEKLMNQSQIDRKFTILKEKSEGSFKYLVIDNNTGEFVNLSDKIKEANKIELIKYLNNL